MRLFKRYFSLLVPLFALLVGIESIMLVNRAVKSHEDVASKNYAIIIVSQKTLNIDSIKSQIEGVASLVELDSSAILSEISASLSSTNISDIEVSLPYFYSLRLKEFPNQYKIKQVENSLFGIDGVQRVESFNKSRTQTYRILVLLKGCVLIFAGIIFVLSFLLMLKQIEVWRFEHSERMEIMTYLGAPSKYKNAALYRLAYIGSLLSSLFVIIGLFILSNNAKIRGILALLEIEIFSVQFFVMDYFILLISAFVISMICVFIVILLQKEP